MTGVWVSLGTRMLTSVTVCPVLLSTALCSIAHSSGASRLALEQRAAQPGCAAAFAGGVSDGDGAGVGAVCAARGAALDLGACWASLGDPVAARAARIANFAMAEVRD